MRVYASGYQENVELGYIVAKYKKDYIPTYLPHFFLLTIFLKLLHFSHQT